MDVSTLNTPGLKAIPPRKVRITGAIGPFAGMEGTAVAQDSRLIWVKFDEPGQYAPYDHPGTYGFTPDYVEDMEDAS